MPGLELEWTAKSSSAIPGPRFPDGKYYDGGHVANFRVWPNAERQVIAWLTQHTGHTVYSKLPNNFGENLPVVQVTRSGGTPGADTITGAATIGNDRTIDVEVIVFERTRGALWAAVQKVETAMGGLAANGSPEWYVDDVTEIFAFAVDNYENETKERAAATYGVTVRPLPQPHRPVSAGPTR